MTERARWDALDALWVKLSFQVHAWFNALPPGPVRDAETLTTSRFFQSYDAWKIAARIDSGLDDSALAALVWSSDSLASFVDTYNGWRDVFAAKGILNLPPKARVTVTPLEHAVEAAPSVLSGALWLGVAWLIFGGKRQ